MTTMHIAVTGSSGLIGRRLVSHFQQRDYRVTRLVREDAGDSELLWEPAAGRLDCQSLVDCDAVVHLAGESLAEGRWSAEKKQQILKSRVESTRLLSRGLATLNNGPRIFISASAVGYYGDCGNQELDEQSPVGSNYLADVCRQWEAATETAKSAGIRVVNLRIGVVLAKEGGALKKMLTPFRLGLGGRIGNGRQYWSWIAIDDLISIIDYALVLDKIVGPVNAVAPHPATNRQFTKTLGRVLRRPTLFPLPAFMARSLLGEMADALLLSSAQVLPRHLIDHGYGFQFGELEAALRHILSREK
ncbi:MAG: TIGR01777 family oxidoreductase [Planctomycetales bacterium]